MSVRAAQGQSCLQEQAHPSASVGFTSPAFSQPELNVSALGLLRDSDSERDTPRDQSLQDNCRLEHVC